MNLYGKKDLGEALQHQPPAAILTGFEEEKTDAELVRYARKNGYREVDFSGRGKLWLPK